MSRLDQVELLKSLNVENNFNILSGQLIPMLTHFYTEFLNAFIHKSNQNFPCCNLWCSPLALSHTPIFYLQTPQGCWRLQKEPPRALLFFTENKTSLVNLSLGVTCSSNLTILGMLFHAYSLTMVSLLHWGPKTAPVCSSWMLFNFLSSRASRSVFGKAAISNMAKMELSTVRCD